MRKRSTPPGPLLILGAFCLVLIAACTKADAATPPTHSSRPSSFPAPLASLPAAPAGWPSTVEIGSSNPLGGAADLRSVAPFGFRYQYLAGGVNTGDDWLGWKPAGSYVSAYIRESVDNGVIPVFTYYELLQSKPGGSSDESKKDAANLQNVATMKAYWQDLTSFYRQSAESGRPVVLHMEPDLWGYAEQRSSGEDASTMSVRVAQTGLPDLAGLPDTMAGFAQAVLHLRDLYAPNVIVAYHLSSWGTGTAIPAVDPSDSQVEDLARQSARFYASLHANFDLAFAEFSDRDAAFNQAVRNTGPSAWWDDSDYARNVRYLSAFVQAAGTRVVMWQIPLGNTKMRAMNNKKWHYQDNRVEWLLDDAGRAHLQAYVDAGVIGFLFGPGAEGTTCACDRSGDGVTNPKPIDGNDRESLNADDDGGFFKEQVALYYAGGAIPIRGGPAQIAVADTTP